MQDQFPGMEPLRDQVSLRRGLQRGPCGDRNLLEIGEGANFLRPETRSVEQPSIPRNTPVSMLSQCPQSASLKCFELRAIPAPLLK